MASSSLRPTRTAASRIVTLGDRLGGDVSKIGQGDNSFRYQIENAFLSPDGERLIGKINASTVAILTKKDPEALEVLRHSAAHLMADAILRLFPAAELTIGPVVEDRFYYDIHLPEGKITPEDFPKIEQEMKRLAKEKTRFSLASRRRRQGRRRRRRPEQSAYGWRASRDYHQA